MALFDLYDAHANANFKNPKPYPRPWDPPPKQYGNARFSISELEAVLNQHRGMTSYKVDARGRMHDSRGRFVAASRAVDEGEVRGG